MSVAQMKFKGIIFDMDGTLIESTEADFLAWQKTFKDYNRALTFETYKPLLGIKSADVATKVLGLTNDDDIKLCLTRKLDHFRNIVATNRIKPVDGAEKLLISVSQLHVKVALATSSRQQKMHMVMMDLQFLQYFDEVVTGEEVTQSKPAPDIFLLAAKKLALQPEDCLVIEDAVAGVTAAKAAGMKCIAITTTHNAAQLHEADLIIDSFENIDLAALSIDL